MSKGNSEVRIGRIEATLERVVTSLERVTQAQEKNAAFLRSNQRLLRVVIQEGNERLRALDERLNILLTVMEKHITGPDHGKTKEGKGPQS